jgi:Tol biopolymer transport system component
MTLKTSDRVLWAITGVVALALAATTVLFAQRTGTWDRLREAVVERRRQTSAVERPGQDEPEPATADEEEPLPEPTPTAVPAAPERVLFIAAAQRSPEEESEAQVHLWSMPAAGGEVERLAEAVQAHSFGEAAPWSFSGGAQGQKLAFLQGPTEDMRLMTVDLRSGEAREMLAASDGWWLASPSFSPDGQQLAFLNIEPPPSGEFHDSQYGTVYVVRADDGDIVRQFERAAIWTPLAWSSDGQWLAVVEAGGGTRWPRLTLLPGGDGEPMVAPFARAWQGTWLPKGQQMLAVRGQPGGGVELMAWDVAAGEFQPFVLQNENAGQLPGVVWNLNWSADGEWLSGLAGEEWEALGLYAVAREGGEPVQLFAEEGSTVLWSRWAPDGGHLAFIVMQGASSDDAEEEAVDGYVVQPDGSGLWQVDVGLEGRVAQMAWSPDGQRLVFALNSGEGPEAEGRLYTVALEDQRPALLHEGLGRCYYLLWLPALAGGG